MRNVELIVNIVGVWCSLGHMVTKSHSLCWWVWWHFCGLMWVYWRDFLLWCLRALVIKPSRKLNAAFIWNNNQQHLYQTWDKSITLPDGFLRSDLFFAVSWLCAESLPALKETCCWWGAAAGWQLMKKHHLWWVEAGKQQAATGWLWSSHFVFCLCCFLYVVSSADWAFRHGLHLQAIMAVRITDFTQDYTSSISIISICVFPLIQFLHI